MKHKGVTSLLSKSVDLLFSSKYFTRYSAVFSMLFHRIVFMIFSWVFYGGVIGFTEK